MDSKTDRNIVIKAQLVILHHDKDCRIIKAIEGTKLDYIPGIDETGLDVIAKPATVEMLKIELGRLSMIIDDIPTINKVARQFRDEITSRKGGFIAFVNEPGHKGFYVVTKFLEDEETLKEHGWM